MAITGAHFNYAQITAELEGILYDAMRGNGSASPKRSGGDGNSVPAPEPVAAGG